MTSKRNKDATAWRVRRQALYNSASTNKQAQLHERTRPHHLGADRSRQTRPPRRSGRQGRAATEGGTGPAGDGADGGVAAGTQNRRARLQGRGGPCYADPVRRGDHVVALPVRAG